MRNRMLFRALIGVCVILVGAIALAVTTAMHSAPVQGDAPPMLAGGSLASATSDQIAQVALSIVKQDFTIRSGTPQAVLSRPITEDELPAIGLGRVSFAASQHPPLSLVILKGDFGTAHLPGTGKSASDRFQYVGYVFDLWAGVPTKTMASPDGGIFRTALNDGALPAGKALDPGPPQPTAAVNIPYGGVVPTAATG